MKSIVILLATALAITPALADAKGKQGKAYGHSESWKHAAKGKKFRKNDDWHSVATARSSRAADRIARNDVEREIRRIIRSRPENAGLEHLLVAQGVAGVLGQQGLSFQDNGYREAQYREVRPAPGDRLIARPEPVPGDRLIGRVVPGVGDQYFDDPGYVTRRDYDYTRPSTRDDYGYLPFPGNGDTETSALAPLTSPKPRPSMFGGASSGGVDVAALDSTITTSPLTDTPARSAFQLGDQMPVGYESQYVVLTDLERFALPPTGADAHYVRVGNDAVLVGRSDRLVRDVLPLGTLMIQ